MAGFAEDQEADVVVAYGLGDGAFGGGVTRRCESGR